jgi:hypothetical protein
VPPLDDAVEKRRVLARIVGWHRRNTESDHSVGQVMALGNLCAFCDPQNSLGP